MLTALTNEQFDDLACPLLLQQSPALLQVLSKKSAFCLTILQTLQVLIQQRMTSFRQTIHHPLRLPLCLYKSKPPHKPKLLRDLYLIGLQNLHQVTHAQRPLLQEIQDTQPLHIAQAFVDADQFHACYILYLVYAYK